MTAKGDDSAAIGSEAATAGTVTIYDGVISATGGSRGAGIGGGNNTNKDSSGNNGTVIIYGGTVTAKGGDWGAGIGGGAYSYGSDNAGHGGHVEIHGGTVAATGGIGAAGIGGGVYGNGGTIIITGGSVKAVAGKDAEDIGGGKGRTNTGTLKNADGSDVSLYTLTFTGAEEETEVLGLYDGEYKLYDYGTNDMTTKGADDKLYLYLPSGAEERVRYLNTDKQIYAIEWSGKNGTATLWHTHDADGDVYYVKCSDEEHKKCTPCTGCSDTVGYAKEELEAHTWAYAGEGAKLTESCSYNCGAVNTVTLKAAENLVYDGTKKENVFSTEGAFAGTKIPAIDCDDEIINAGTYTATLTVGGATAKLEVTIAQSATSLIAELKDNKSVYTYGETVNISVTPAAMGTRAKKLMARFAAPAAGQVSLWNGETQIAEAKSAANGQEIAFALSTVENGFMPGSYTLTARYTESDNMAAQTAEVSFTVAYAETEKEPDASGKQLEDGCFAQSPTLTAPEGTTISLDNGPDAVWSDEITLPTEDGTHTYTYYVKLEDGTIAEKTETFTVDTTPPEVAEPEILVSPTMLEITAPATDALSGVLDYRLTVRSGRDKEKLTVTDNGGGSYTVTGLIPGETYKFTLTVRDRAGHTTAVSFDVTAPLLPATGDNSALSMWLAMLTMAGAGGWMTRRKVHN